MAVRKPIAAINGFFSEGHQRTIIAKRNIAATFLIKGASILISLLLVPLTIHYVNPTEFGIWLTMSSFLTLIAYYYFTMDLVYTSTYLHEKTLRNVTALALATILLCVLCAIIETIQYKKLIHKRATGIWNK